jgi:uncharacterized membrane protein YheB (UPF0754 family)
MDKGTLSNLASATVLLLGLLLADSPLQAILLSVGLFALSGGITNALAVKMLFDRIPGLVGSGVIPGRFREIRREIKQLIMKNFFSEEYLRAFLAETSPSIDWSSYLKSSSGDQGPFAAVVEAQWHKLTAPGVLKPIIREQIDRLMAAPLGGLLFLAGSDTIESVVGDFVSSFVGKMKPRVLEAAARFQLDPGALGVELAEEKIVADLRDQVNRLLERKLEELNAARVKRMMEDVMRKHLGWLVVWGNVFGGLLGLLAYILGGTQS